LFALSTSPFSPDNQTPDTVLSIPSQMPMLLEIASSSILLLTPELSYEYLAARRVRVAPSNASGRVADN
jgi:hypothetical protein